MDDLKIGLRKIQGRFYQKIRIQCDVLISKLTGRCSSAVLLINSVENQIEYKPKLSFQFSITIIFEIQFLVHSVKRYYFLKRTKLKGSYYHLNFVIFKKLIFALEVQSILCGFYSGF